MIPYLSAEVQQLLAYMGLTLMGVALLVAFGVAIGVLS
jgi:hypothetical protein